MLGGFLCGGLDLLVGLLGFLLGGLGRLQDDDRLGEEALADRVDRVARALGLGEQRPDRVDDSLREPDAALQRGDLRR